MVRRAILAGVTHDELLRLAEHRWRVLREQRADLAGAIDLQRVLVTRGLDLGAALDRQPLPGEPRPAGALAARLAEGEPVGLDEGIEVDPALVGPYLLGFCDDLAAGGAGAPARHLREVLERGEIDVGSLLAASLGRRQAAIRTRAQHVGVSPDLTWVVAEMAVGPLACRLRRRTFAAAEGHAELAGALARWGRGYCPACGSWPALAELGNGDEARAGDGDGAAHRDGAAHGDGAAHRDGAAHGEGVALADGAAPGGASGGRRLRCSFCGAGWPRAEGACIYCSARGDTLLTAAGSGEGRRAELCRSCGGYLKCVAAGGGPAPFELLPVADLETSDLDAGAMQRGYGRPSMREADAPAPPCPPP